MVTNGVVLKSAVLRWVRPYANCLPYETGVNCNYILINVIGAGEDGAGEDPESVDRLPCRPESSEAGAGAGEERCG